MFWNRTFEIPVIFDTGTRIGLRCAFYLNYDTLCNHCYYSHGCAHNIRRDRGIPGHEPACIRVVKTAYVITTLLRISNYILNIIFFTKKIENRIGNTKSLKIYANFIGSVLQCTGLLHEILDVGYKTLLDMICIPCL